MIFNSTYSSSWGLNREDFLIKSVLTRIYETSRMILIVVILIWTLFWRFKFKMVNIYIYICFFCLCVSLLSMALQQMSNSLSMFLPVYGNMKDLNIFYYHIHEVSWNYVFLLLLSQSNSFFSTCVLFTTDKWVWKENPVICFWSKLYFYGVVQNNFILYSILILLSQNTLRAESNTS